MPAWLTEAIIFWFIYMSFYTKENEILKVKWFEINFDRIYFSNFGRTKVNSVTFDDIFGSWLSFVFISMKYYWHVRHALRFTLFPLMKNGLKKVEGVT